MKQVPPDAGMNRDRTVPIGMEQITFLYRFRISLCSAIGPCENVVSGAKSTRQTYDSYENIQL
jgi:hypothetical protein